MDKDKLKYIFTIFVPPLVFLISIAPLYYIAARLGPVSGTLFLLVGIVGMVWLGRWLKCSEDRE